ncbi:MAG: ORF6N domain-containing protein [Deltaproteobacteria bacterium]|nr:ORF6N domain-containing protein [Deltaproteobacteria bacterium]
MLGADLARLYGVSAKRLNEAVRPNRDRFPDDFTFQLTREEFEELTRQIYASNLRSQFATSSCGGRRYLPYAFTEPGVAMLSSVLRSKRAIRVNVEIMRAFVRLRRMLTSNEELAGKLGALEKRCDVWEDLRSYGGHT